MFSLLASEGARIGLGECSKSGGIGSTYYGALTSVVRKTTINPHQTSKMMKKSIFLMFSGKRCVARNSRLYPILSFRTYATRNATLPQTYSGALTSVVRKTAVNPPQTAKMMKKYIFLIFRGRKRCVARNALFYPIETKSEVTIESRFKCQNLCHTIFYTFLGLLWRPYQRSKENNCKSTPNSKNDGKVQFPDV